MMGIRVGKRMVTIVKISVHEKKRQYYKIGVLHHDGRESDMTIHEDILVTQGLRKGLEMTEKELRDLQLLESKNGAYQAAIRYLGYRMRSTKEMQDYLEKKGFDPYILADTISRLLKENLLNDLEYAKAYVRSKMKTSVKGPAVILNELRQRGIQEKDANAALKEYAEALQYDNALHFAKKKLKSSNSISYKEQIQKIAVQLMQKGFGRDLISEVMRELPEENQEQEWVALVSQAQKTERKLSKHDERTKQYKLRTLLYRKGFSLSQIDKYLNELHEE
jgi:regulatory protein